MKGKILIVGGSSKIAKYLVPFLKKKKLKVISTTRKKKYIKESFYLNLHKINNFKISSNIDVIIFLAYISSIKECEENYSKVYKINGQNIPELIIKFLKKKNL